MLRWLKSNHQILTAIGAMLVGLAALFVAWDQARVMRAQQHGAVYPVLQVDGFVATTAQGVSIGVTVSNNGVGPAIIENVSIRRDDELVEGFDAFLTILPEGSDLSWSGATGRALAPGARFDPIRITWARDEVTDLQIRSAGAAWDAWDVRFCYCSVFERCWATSNRPGARAERVEECVPGDADPFEALGASRQAEAEATP